MEPQPLPDETEHEPVARFEKLEIPLPETMHGMDHVTGTLGKPEWWPTGARSCVVLAQATAAKDPQLEALQKALTERRYMTLRFPMPYMVAKRRRPDSMKNMAHVYERAINALMHDPNQAPARVFAGGKNMGARAVVHINPARLRLQGMFFLGFPLHRQDKPEEIDETQLYRLELPLLFIQGERDRNCDLPALRKALSRCGAPIALHRVENTDHRLRRPKRPRSAPDSDVEILETLDDWIKRRLRART